ENPVQNMLLTVLASMAPPSIPEAFGHNKPLFIADKIAKWHYHIFKKIIDSAKTWVMNRKDVRSFVFYMSSFRDKRSEFEQARRSR
ncbi:MAG: hypothetical protein ACTSUS_02130, partial [Candidatus Freyarchaeota archaeon]